MSLIPQTPKYLINVSDMNNNKFYRMIPHGDSWTAEFGRVGSSCQKREYPMSEWDKKYFEKTEKHGYVDKTDLMEDLISEKRPDGPKYKEIKSESIRDIVKRLRSMAKEAIAKNYNISSGKVTQAMVDEAQKIIDSMIFISNSYTFNQTLLQLFKVIPRKMSDVNSFLVPSGSDPDVLKKTIKREQDLLDVMRGQIVSKAIDEPGEVTEEFRDKTILDVLGLEFEECSESDIEKIKDLLGESKKRFIRAWKVNNQKTDEKFRSFVEKEKIKDTKFLWHGSRNENWWSIINTGLVLRPTNAVITGKMFGYGLYYAPKAKKSIGYTSIEGSYWARGGASTAFMAVMEVAYGKPYDVYSFEPRFNSLTYDSLQKMCPGANCLHAHAGNGMLRNDEIIVYKEDQCTIRYLVEIGKE